jgi:YD repeat-containing protein
MNLKTFIGTLLATATLSYSSIAQTSTALMPSMENVVPPSPNVAAINKFGNIPVGLSTGIPSVGVPIYEWKGQNFGINFKVSLDYHAGGIKVDEMASSVGLGWALNAGGVISRTKRGIPDEVPVDGFLDRTLPVDASGGNAPVDYANSDRLLYRMNAGYIDTQNDIFSYNFNGRSGRFVLGKDSNILFLDNAKLKVAWEKQPIGTSTLFSKCTLTDELGYKYVFSAYETTLESSSSPYGRYTSAWHLTQIINPSGKDSIVLQYEDTDMNVGTSMSSTEAIPVTLDGVKLGHAATGGSQPFVNTKRIKSIIFPDQNTVNFTYDNVKRQDVNNSNDYLLKKITISKGVTSRGFLLNQNYSLGGRATLLSVREVGGTQETPLKPYTFEYYTSANLPARLTAAQDHWGYPNVNAGPLIPHEFFPAPGGQYPPYREFSGGNRDTDPERVKAASITRITYPTGGYTVFELEANRAKDNWLEQNVTVSVPGAPYADRSINAPVSSANNPAGVEPFIFQGENNSSTNFKIRFEPGGCSSNCALKFEIYNPSGLLMTTQQVDFSSGTTTTLEKTFNLSSLVKGTTYTIRIFTINATDFYKNVSIEWREVRNGTPVQQNLVHVQPYVGGLRAKMVSDYLPGASTPATVREYEYVMEDGTTSSGALGFRPIYSQMAFYDYKYDETLPTPPAYFRNAPDNYILRSASSVYDLAYANGSPVTYKRVVERIGQGSNNIGKIVRYFTNFSDSPPVVQDVFPKIPTNLHSYSYGLLLREETYNAAGILLKKAENSYRFISNSYARSQDSVENFRSISVAPVRFLCPKSHGTGSVHVHPGNTPYYFLMSSFTPVEGRAELTQSKVTELANGKQAEVVTKYTYDPETYLPKETVLINSKKEEKKTVLSYPKDFPANPLYVEMKDKNIIKPVILEQLYTKQTLNANQTLDFSRYTDYKKWSTDVYEPELISTVFKSNPNKDPRIRYLKYDLHGTPLSVQQERGTKICYIWGYGGDYLVAKVSNIEYVTLENLLGGTTAIEAFRNNKTITESAITTFLAPLRTYVSNTKDVLMTDFRYDTLKGIVSQTDEKGITTSYEYDEFQRLMNIRDFGGNIIKNFKYNQQGQ